MTDLFSDRAQERVAEELEQTWSGDQSPSPPTADDLRPGEAFAFLHIPQLGDDYRRAIVEGVEPDELADGPGHYPNSALPGELGNFSMAGHRVGLGSPFEDLDLLQPGDAVVVETETEWFTYRVTMSEIVSPTDVLVVAPTPGAALDSAPTGRFLTMTTCNPKFSNRERLVVHAVLDSAVSKTDAPDGPTSLAES